MTTCERRVLSGIWNFIFGLRFTETELELQIYLEDKFAELQDGQSLFYYFDYNSSGSLYNLISDWEKTTSKHPDLWFGGVNKTGLKVWRENKELRAKTKMGYGKDWIEL